MGTLDKAAAVYSKFKKYNNNADISFNQITYDYLEEYESYLSNHLENGINTIHSNLKIFRMLFNKAVRQDIIELDQNPFLRFKLKTEKTNKEYLSEAELKSLESLVLNNDSSLYHHRNIFVFACYAGGIRISDILQLKWNNFDGSNISITMQKTGDQVSVKLPNKALQILNIYRYENTEGDHYIFPFLSNDYTYSKRKLFQAISSRTASVNKDLKILANNANIKKRVSFHTSRHTYATLALSLGLQISQVSKLMGHANLKVTQQYAKLINKDLDKAMDAFNRL